MEIIVTDSKTGLPKNPANGVSVLITDPADVVVVNDSLMTNDAVGEYHYDYNPLVGAVLGTYEVLITATDGSRITRTRDAFDLHA